MKYIKTYENNNLLSYKYVYNFFKKIVKLFDKKYSVRLTDSNKINFVYRVNDNMTELISQISTHYIGSRLIFEIYNIDYELNNLLEKYFTSIMNKVYDRDYVYSYEFNSKTRLNAKDFEAFLNANKYNL